MRLFKEHKATGSIVWTEVHEGEEGDEGTRKQKERGGVNEVKGKVQDGNVRS